MQAGPVYSDFPALRTGAPSGAGDEEVFETKASPPAVAGPLFAEFANRDAVSTNPFATRPGAL